MPEQIERTLLPRLGTACYEPEEQLEGLADLRLSPSYPDRWPLGPQVAEQGFATGTNGATTLQFRLAAGAYRASLEARDAFGRLVTNSVSLAVLRPAEKRLALKVPTFVATVTTSVEPGKSFLALWGTGYSRGRALVEIEHRCRIVRRYWTRPGRTQEAIRLPITEALRGGFILRVTQVSENRAYSDERLIEVPWTNKELKLRWEHFRSKPQPGQKESWAAVVSGPKHRPEMAEFAATLYDSSLDAFIEHAWLRYFNPFYHEETPNADGAAGSFDLSNDVAYFHKEGVPWGFEPNRERVTYRSFPANLIQTIGGRDSWLSDQQSIGFAVRLIHPRAMMVAAPALMLPSPAMLERRTAARLADERRARAKEVGLSRMAARKKLSETAFFLPQLVTGRDGSARLEFTMPETLTGWHFMAFAHDRALRSGFLEGRAVTAKDLMVQPNPPRFLRAGDVLEFPVKVLNQSTGRQRGKVGLPLRLAQNDQPADTLLGNGRPELDVDVPAKESRTYTWKLTVPDECDWLVYKAVASTGALSDGEEGHLPVLSRRVMLTESLPLNLTGPALTSTNSSSSGSRANPLPSVTKVCRYKSCQIPPGRLCWRCLT